MTIGSLWLPSLGAPPTPLRLQSVVGPTASQTSITTGSASPSANDLLIGAGYSGSTPAFNAYTWSGGETNNHVNQNASGFCSFSFNYAVAGAATTFNFTTTGSQTLGAILLDLIPVNTSVAPTFNASSAVVGSNAGAGPVTVTLGSYTTLLNDCIIMVLSGQNNGASQIIVGSGAGARWQTVQDLGAAFPAMYVLIGYGCTAGNTTMTWSFQGGGSDTVHYGGGVFSGVAT